MSPRRTRRGTIRESVAEISVDVDSSLKSSQKLVRSSRRINKSQVAKGSEEDSDNPSVEVNSIIDSRVSTSLLNDSATNTRRRNRKGQEVSKNQNTTLPTTVGESKNKSHAKKSNARTPRSKKPAQSSRFESVDINSLISEDESFNTKNQKSKRQVSYTIDNILSEDEEVTEISSTKKVKLDNKNKKDAKPPSRKTSSNKLSIKLTPDQKSSPLNVSLTPDRSRKTPIKSPVNLGSPKTHTHDALRLLLLPRKLSITDSPPSSEASINSPQQSSELIKNQKNSKSTSKISTSPTLKAPSRFSKSPKIMFKTPKSTSKTNKKSLFEILTPKDSPPSKSKKLTKNVSPSKSKKSSKIDIAAKSEKAIKNVSPAKSIKSQKADLVLKFKKTPEIDSLSESLKSPESVSSSKKTPKTISPVKSKKAYKATSSGKSKVSSKFILPLSSKKMPKIVLNLKSKKSLTKSKSLSPSKLKKSVEKSCKSLSPSKLKKSLEKSSVSKSSSKSKKSPKTVSPLKTQKVPSNKSARKSNFNNDLSENLSMSPRVIVNKLSASQVKNSSLSGKENQLSIHLVPVDHVHLSTKLEHKKSLPSSKKSPKAPKLSVKRQSLIKSATPAKSIGNRLSVTRKSNETNVNLKINTPVDVLEKRLMNLKPASTSTPRERVKRSLTLASGKKDSSIQLTINNSIRINGSTASKPKVIKRLNNQSKIEDDHLLLEDESEPSINDTSLIRMSEVFDISGKDNTFELNKSDSSKRKSPKGANTSRKSNKSSTFEVTKNSSSTSTKEKSKMNNTYELENPKTPAIKANSYKRTSHEAELEANEEPESKKSCKVHFASPELRNQVRPSGINRIGTPGRAMQQKTPLSANKARTPVVNKLDAKVNLVSKSQVRVSISTPVNKRKSLSGVSLSAKKSDHQSQITSVNRLSRPKTLTDSKKKTETKTPVARKIPNFAQIHQKNFAKMESLVEMKKRVEMRHVTLNTGPSSAKKTPSQISQNRTNKPVAADSTDGTYNRFGFKLRKNDAINIISKKQTGGVDSRDKKRENARSTLKGVRMNRRFELQMQARNKNS